MPGHEIVGRIDLIGRDVVTHRTGDRVGIPWLGHTCVVCRTARTAWKISATVRYSASRSDADLQYLPNDSPGLCYIWGWSETTATMHGIRRTAPPQITSHGRYAMTRVFALSLSIAVLGGIWAFLALGPLSGFVL